MLIDASVAGASHPGAPPIAVIARPLGIQTNNFAEYTAVVLALRRAHELGADEVELVLDSKLIVEQMSGRWKIKHPQIVPLAAQAQAELRGFTRWSIRHEPRANNHQADAMANLALDDPRAAAAVEAGLEVPVPAPRVPARAGLSWAELADESFDVAAAGERIFGRSSVAYLATLRDDGAPAIRPATLSVESGRLIVDGPLPRDPRYSLYASAGDEEILIQGRAAADELLVERVFWTSRVAGRPRVVGWPA